MEYLILITSLCLIGGVSFLSGKLIEKIKLPALIGMMLTGMLLGPNVINIIPQITISSSSYIKDIALVIVLFIAGLGISWTQMKQIGRPAVLLSVIPASLEGLCIAILSIFLLGFSFVQGGILGFIIAAVSPAVLIPSMLDLMKRGLGEDKAIPEMLIVGASADDTIAITFFTMFLNIQLALSNGGTVNYANYFFSIPFSIILCIALAWLVVKGWIFLSKSVFTSNIVKLCSIAIIIISLRLIENIYHFSLLNSLLTIMIIGFFLRKYDEKFSLYLKAKMQYIWEYGKLYLFFFVGMVIDPTLVGVYFPIALLMLSISLIIRSFGVWLSLLKTNLSWKERLFCIVAYLPKATVQSAKSGVPLQYGIPGAEIMQAIAIMSVLITAPIGAIGIKILAPICLTTNPEKSNS